MSKLGSFGSCGLFSIGTVKVPFFLRNIFLAILKKAVYFYRMISPKKSQVLAALPIWQNKMVLLAKRQDTRQLVEIIRVAHIQDANDYDRFYNEFEAPTVEGICKKIWLFLKQNVKYVEETEDGQTVKTPAAIIQTGQTIGSDCKNYALFSGGILDAFKRAGYRVSWCYRLAGYGNSQDVGHIFVVVNPNTQNEIWLDATMKGNFNDQRIKPSIFYDEFINTNMATYKISGANPPNFSDVFSQSSGGSDTSGKIDFTQFQVPTDFNTGKPTEISDVAGFAANIGVDIGSQNWQKAISDALAFLPKIFAGHSDWWKFDEALKNKDWGAVKDLTIKMFVTDYGNGKGFQGALIGLIDPRANYKPGQKRYNALADIYKETRNPQILDLYQAAVAGGYIKPDPLLPSVNTNGVVQYLDAQGNPIKPTNTTSVKNKNGGLLLAGAAIVAILLLRK